MSKTVHLIDDEPHVLQAIKLLLETEGFEVKDWADANSFLASSCRSGCIISDVRMPSMSGLELVVTLREMGDKRPVVLLTGHGDIAMAVNALKLGAFDFLEKPFKNDEFIATVQAALEKASADNHASNERHSIRERYETLSERQKDTMHLLIQGLSSKEIAQKLEISPRTVEVHRTWVMNKMAARTLVDLVHMGLALEITTQTSSPRSMTT